jgi:adenine phosphoribosyltransferase
MMNKEEYEKLIVSVPDFPKEGVVFKDIMPVLKERYSDVVEDLSKHINWDQIDYIVGIESRGFILGCGMAEKHKKGFIPVRKKGKLPPPVTSESYELEYGSDTLEMASNTSNKRVLIVDDVLATGGTMQATIKLCQKNNYEIMGVSVLIDLTFLNNLRDQYPHIHSVLKY